MGGSDRAAPARLAELIAAHREDIVSRLTDLEWAADPINGLRLVTGAEAVRPRVMVFLDLIIEGLATGSWDAFDRVIGDGTVDLLANELVTPEDLTDRALRIAIVLIPWVLESSDPVAELSVLFGTMHSLGSRIIARYNRQLMDDLRVVDDVKTMFLRVTTHELRAPMGTVGGYSSMLAAGDFGELPAPAGVAVDAIWRAARSSLSLLDRLVEAARLERGSEPLTRSPQLLADVVAAAVDPLREAAGLKEVRLVVEAGEGQADLDLDEMAIAVRNLVGNALKYASDGGEIRIGAEIEGDSAVFEVADEGPGIAPEELPFVFDRYFRAAVIRGSGIDGSGLGLYIVKRIAELHHGDVTVVSRAGEGTTFRIAIPSSRPEDPPAR
jgi:signal transduction histidine kinase